jgi:hypothetical protein
MTRRLLPAAIGFSVLAVTLASTLYFINSAEGSPTLDALPPTSAVHHVAPPTIAVDAGATFDVGVDWRPVPAEPDPSPRSIAAYEPAS